MCELTNSKILSEKNTHNFLYIFIQVQYEHRVIQCLVDVMTDLAFMAELVKRVGIGKFLGNIELNESVNFQSSISLLEIINSTGLQIKTDPGIPVIYIGFFFLMVSTLISYINYSQIWIFQKNQKIFIGGNTNRAIFEFELEFLKFIK